MWDVVKRIGNRLMFLPMMIKRIRIAKHLFQIDFLLAVRASLFFSYDAPASDTKFVKNVFA